MQPSRSDSTNNDDENMNKSSTENRWQKRRQDEKMNQLIQENGFLRQENDRVEG